MDRQLGLVRLLKSRTIPVAVFDLLVIGALGDLARRKLFVALYHRDVAGQIPDGCRIFGLSRKPHDDDSFREFVHAALREFVDETLLFDESVIKFLKRLQHHKADILEPDGWRSLKSVLEVSPARVRIFYLSVGPTLFAPATKQIHAAGLIHADTRLVVEKPVGHDGESARSLNRTLGEQFDEKSIYRIDHYLGKETVQNLMVLRFANSLFEPIWNRTNIDNIQITAAESVGVGDRVGYYDKSGAMRDMVQNHLLQLLCLVAMEPPSSVAADAVRGEKLKVLNSLQRIDSRTVQNNTVRGQYRSGNIQHQSVRGYDDELGGVASTTPTFVAIKTGIDNWRWNGVPFYLRTGKRLARRFSEIVVQFRDVPHTIFAGLEGQIVSNKLVLRVQPDEAVELIVMIKDPGPGGMRLRQVPLDMCFAEEFEVRHADAYERLLMDVVRGDLTLFMSRDEVEAAWDWVDPVIEGWNNGGEMPATYAAGSWGPEQADGLLEKDGRRWHQIDD